MNRIYQPDNLMGGIPPPDTTTNNPPLTDPQNEHGLQKWRTSIIHLPDELLSHIFILGKHSTKHTRNISQPLLDSWTVKVAQINQWFRDTACNHTPGLWSDISYTMPDPRGDDVVTRELLFSIVELTLDRSGQVPLDLLFWEHEEVTGQSEFRLQPLRRYLSMLVPHVHRWRSLEIHSLHYGCLFLLLDTFRLLHVPMLEKLFVEAAPYPNVVVNADAIFRFGAPCLSQIDVRNFFLDISPLTTLRTLRMSFQYVTRRLLTSLELYVFYVVGSTAILSRALLGSHNSLTHVHSFHMSHEERTPVTEGLPDVLSKMRSLSKLTLWGSSGEPVLRLLTVDPACPLEKYFPCLHSLTVQDRDYKQLLENWYDYRR